MADLSKLQEERNKLAADLRSHATESDKSGWTAEANAKWDELNKAYDGVKAQIDAENASLEAAAKRQERLAEIENHGGHPLRDRIGRDGASLEDGPQNFDAFNGGGGRGRRLADQVVALQGWMLNGTGQRSKLTDRHRAAAAAVGASLDDREFVLDIGGTEGFKRARAEWGGRPRNAMTAGSGSAGGFTVGQTLVGTLEKAMLDFSGVLQVADVIRTDNGEPLYWPTVDDTANTGSRVGEGADAGTASDPSFGRVSWSAYDFTSGLLNVSRNLLTDSIFNLEEVIGQLMGERLGRKQNTDYTTGGGGGIAPRGIVTASTAGKTAASATAIVFDELIDLEHSIDPSRRNMPGVGYMFHDSILQALRKLKDGEGRYLWQSGANAGAPDTLNARPYAVNQAMASTIASGAKTVLFGQLSAYKVRQVGQIRLQRLVERRAEFNQDVFIAYLRADGNLLDAGDHPVKHLVH